MSRSKLKSRATLADVAAAASVSRGAVSQALSSKPSTIKLREETRQRILAAAERLNYKPDMRARGLVMRRSYLAALLGRRTFDSWYVPISRGVEQELRSHSYSLLSYIHGNTASDEEEHLRLSIDRTVDGLIVMPSLDPDTGAHNGAVFERLTDQGTPVVQVFIRVTDKVPAVVRHFPAAADLAIEHLYELGHRRMALASHYFAVKQRDPFNAHQDTRVYRERYIQNMTQRGLEPQIFESEPTSRRAVKGGLQRSLEVGKELAGRVLASSPRPTAVIFPSDFAAYGFLHGLLEQGVHVPQEMSVVATHNEEPSSFIYPSLTSTTFEYEQIGSLAGRMLMQMLDGSDRPDDVVLKPSLIVRQSTGPAAEH